MLCAILLFLLQISPLQKITTAFGPEDIATHPSNKELIIISCTNRISGTPSTGKLQYFNIQDSSLTARDFIIENYQENKLLPHGIFSRKLNGDDVLYVISHEEKDRIVVFKIKHDTLIYQRHFEDPKLDRPNDLYVDKDGRIFFTNTHNYIKGFFRAKKASIGLIQVNGKIELILEKRRGANGICRYQNDLYFTDDLDDTLYKMEDYFINTNKKIQAIKLAKLSVGDNINTYNESLIITSHPSLFKFYFHSKDRFKQSPTAVHIFDGNKLNQIYYSNGTEISGGSSSLIIDGHLYIAQVFNNYLLKVPIEFPVD